MALILRYCILSQKKRFAQEFLLFHHNVSGNIYNSNNIKKFGSILNAKHFSVKSDEDSDRQLIYEGPLSYRIRILKIFSLSTSFGSVLAQPIIYMKAVEDDNLISLGLIFAFMNFFAIISPLFIHLIAKKYVTEMYYYPKEDKYAAKVFGVFPIKKQITFTKDDVEVPESAGMLTSCIVHGKPLLLDVGAFKDVRHYYLIMGYNKPIDLELGDNATITGNINIELIREKLKNAQKNYKELENKQQEQN